MDGARRRPCRRPLRRPGARADTAHPDRRHPAAGGRARVRRQHLGAIGERAPREARGGRAARAQAQGRHRYFRIASPEVAGAVESLGSLSKALRPRTPRGPALPKAAPAAVSAGAHLLRPPRRRDRGAGLRGDAQSALAESPRDGDFRADPAGQGAARRARRRRRAGAPLAARVRARLRGPDPRRPHIGGALGAALLEMYLARGWILRMRGSRAVGITPKGREASPGSAHEPRARDGLRARMGQGPRRPALRLRQARAWCTMCTTRSSWPTTPTCRHGSRGRRSTRHGSAKRCSASPAT